MNNLKEIRKQNRLTQAELANFIGITQNTYSYWENDKVKIDNESLKKLADYFNVSVDYILGRSSEDMTSNYNLTEILGNLSWDNLTDEQRQIIVKLAYEPYAKNNKK